MNGSWLDHLPSKEREKIRKRMRSPEAYEQLRERVKGPEDLEKEMTRSERLAELSFAMETEPAMKEKLQAMVRGDFQASGVENVIDDAQKLPYSIAEMLRAGQFEIGVTSHPRTHEDALVIMPEGNVQEKLPVNISFTDRYIGQALQKGEHHS